MQLFDLPRQVVLPQPDGLSEPPTGALALGKAFHGTLARNFRQKMTTGRDMEAGEVSEAFAEE
jgi:hypothetical protein